MGCIFIGVIISGLLYRKGSLFKGRMLIYDAYLLSDMKDILDCAFVDFLFRLLLSPIKDIFSDLEGVKDILLVFLFRFQIGGLGCFYSATLSQHPSKSEMLPQKGKEEYDLVAIGFIIQIDIFIIELEIIIKMFKSKNFECSTGTIINPLDMTQDKIQDLKAQENFIARLKKQKEKMEILNSEFQQQDTLITEQEHLIKTLTASNNQLKVTLQECAQKIEVLEIQNSEKSEVIYSLEAAIEKLTNDFTRVSQAYGMEKILVKDSQQKLHEQQNMFSKNYNSLKESTKMIEKQTNVLKEKYQQKNEEAKELIKSLQLAEKTIVKLHQKVKKLQLENQHVIQKYEESMDETTKHIHSLKIENEALKNKVSVQTKQLNQLQHSCSLLSKQVQNLTTISEQKQSKATKLQDHLRNTLDQIKILEEDINNRDHLINDLSLKKQSNSKYRAMKRELMSIRDREAAELDELIESVKQRHL